jgi:hypothetical protein
MQGSLWKPVTAPIPSGSGERTDRQLLATADTLAAKEAVGPWLEGELD